MFKRLLTHTTDRIHTLPVLVLMPHSRCNCRCIMCDIWKANHLRKEISVDLLKKNVESFRKLGVAEVTLSGGEALMHANLWKFCEELKGVNIRISLLSTGLLLAANADEIIRWCDEVIVSIDGGREVHNAIRNIPSALEKLEQGVASLKKISPGFRITGRCVLQKSNFREFTDVVAEAHRIGLDRISFLAADVSSSAFNHSEGWGADEGKNIALSSEEADEFEKILHQSFQDFRAEYDSKYIAESPAKMLSLVQYYRANHSEAPFPGQRCNAPWVSAVIESNGDVMPCFFHKPYGNIAEGSFEEIINSEKAISFRKHLDVSKNDICKKCVCSLYIRPW